jgi:DNA-binding MarR family transcriptional regulator
MPPSVKTRNSADTAAGRLPLPTLLSQVLVAFTIEFDNEFEHQTPHRTTISTSAAGLSTGPWLTSLVMWSNLMRFVDEKEIRVGELQNKGGNLAGMLRWGYITAQPDTAHSRGALSARSAGNPRGNWVVRPTAKGKRAQDIWRALFGTIEKRWETRFGKTEINNLRQSLRAIVSQFDFELPQYLPVLGYGLRAKLPPGDGRTAARGSEDDELSRLPLSALLSKVLFAFAIEFDRESNLSIAISANVIRILDEKAMPIRELSHLSGVSKEAIKMCLGFLEKGRYIAVESNPEGGKGKSVRLTPKGRMAQDAYRQLIGEIEDRWQARYGKERIRSLREFLEPLVGEPTADLSPLFRGLVPYPEGWRASIPEPQILPHYPMVLHRGGYPDGS